jgi:hypothetical protein
MVLCFKHRDKIFFALLVKLVETHGSETRVQLLLTLHFVSSRALNCWCSVQPYEGRWYGSFVEDLTIALPHNTWTYIHTTTRIRSHGPKVWTACDLEHLTPPGKWGRQTIWGCIQKFPDWVDKEIKTTTNPRWVATQRVMAAKLTRLTHKIAIQLHLVAESCTIYRSLSRRQSGKFWIHPGIGQYQR